MHKHPADDKPQPRARIYYVHLQPNGLPEKMSGRNDHLVWRAQYWVWGSAVAEGWQAFDGVGGRGRRRGTPPRQNSCRLDRTPVFGVHEGSRRLCSCGRRSAWWATRSVVHGKRAGARSASSTNAQPCRCLQAPARCRVFHPGGEEREASWHDTDKHSKTERWAGCCHRTAPRPTSWRVRSA
ncbi:RHS domain-containing protein [Paracidovorax citrulli]|nr:RHS domain-containing protein [Paracidovorax citrulli]